GPATPASTSDPQRLRRWRRRPRRTIIDFHGTSSTTATPTTPWATATQRPDAVPVATAPTPLANATSSAASRARLVIRGGGARMTGLAPGARHPAIGYLPCHAMAAQSNSGPRGASARDRVTPGQVPGRGSLSDQEQAPRRRRTAGGPLLDRAGGA